MVKEEGIGLKKPHLSGFELPQKISTITRQINGGNQKLYRKIFNACGKFVLNFLCLLSDENRCRNTVHFIES